MSDYVNVPATPGKATDNDDVVVDNTAGGVVLLAANTKRRSALITNVGDEPMRVTTDGSVPTPTHGKKVPAGSSLVLQGPYCPADEVKAIQEGLDSTIANASEVR